MNICTSGTPSKTRPSSPPSACIWPSHRKKGCGWTWHVAGRQAAVNGRRFASFMDDGQDNHGCSCRAIKGVLFVLASQSESGILRCHRILISSPGAVQVVQYPQYPHTNNLYHEVTLDPVSFALSIHKAKVWGRVCKIPKGV